MGKILRVGDPHITVRNLVDAQMLMNFVFDKAKELKVDRVEFMGDLFHTHAVKRLEVEDFWYRILKKFTRSLNVLIVLGNHDMVGNKENDHIHALNVFKPLKNLKIVDKPTIVDQIAYLPYMRDENLFIESAKNLFDQGATEMLVAHQTVDGTKYDNGFYAPDGIKLELIPQKHMISGHIHDQQIIGKCHYIGTPKWDTMSDANKDKGIWLFEHDNNGTVIKSKFISTKDVVTPIVKHTVNEGDELPELNPKANNFVEFIGKTAWINKMKKLFKGKAKIKSRPLDRKMGKIDKEQISTLEDFLKNNFEPIDGVSKDQIHQFLKENVNVG